MALRALFVDFNSYFSSVEQQEQPHLRGRPVAVVPVMTDSTCCIAASYEAKRFGVKTGTNVGEARKKCPGLVIVEARPSLYVDYHHRLIGIVDSCLPVTSVRSIDEMCCALNGRWRERETALGLAREIKARIAKTVGTSMSSSIGIAPNPFLAKTASDMQKPDGLVVIDETDLPGCLFRLQLRDFCGIGESRKRGCTNAESGPSRSFVWRGRRCCIGPGTGLRATGCMRCCAVRRLSAGQASAGRWGIRRCWNRNAGTSHWRRRVLHRLLQKAAARLRSLGYLAAGLSVSVQFLGQKRWGDEMNFLETQDTLEFIRIFELLWKRYPESAPPPLKVGVTFFHLTRVHNVTQHLPQMESSRLALDQAMDRLNQAFGRNTVYFGGAQPDVAAGESRIAFTNIPVKETERKVYPGKT